MEPTDLKSNSPDDTRIEAWLRASSEASPLPDDGFSVRVLAALPPPAFKTQASRSLRPWLCLAGATVGAILVISSGANRGAEGQAFARLVPSLESAFTPLLDPRVLLALGLSALSLALVYWRDVASRLIR